MTDVITPLVWPPPLPPNNRQNITPELDNHPADHNLMADALTAIVANMTRRVASVYLPNGPGQANIGTTTTDLTGVTVTFTADATKRYRATMVIIMQANAALNATLHIAKADNTILQAAIASIPNGYYFPYTVVWEGAPGSLSGSTTLKGRSNTNAGTASVLQGGGFMTLLVVDELVA